MSSRSRQIRKLKEMGAPPELLEQILEKDRKRDRTRRRLRRRDAVTRREALESAA